MTILRCALISSVLLLAARPALAGDPQAAPPAGIAGNGASREPLADAPLGATQGELLEIAFRADSAIPDVPHARDKAKTQASVVEACLALDLPVRAAALLEKIENWRRGNAHAELAFWLAQHGDVDGSRKHIDQAAQIAAEPEGEDGQDWHRDRIRAGIARTLLLLGDTDKAASLAEGLPASESGGLRAEQAQRQPDEALDAALAALAAAGKAGDFDGTRAAQESCARLFDRYYADVERRDKIEAAIKGSWNHTPIKPRIDVLVELVGVALRHGDQPKALQLVHDAQDVLHSVTWNPQDQVPLLAQLGGLAFKAGDAEGARRDIDAARAMFGMNTSRIVDIDRAGALRPVAEAYAILGDKEAALAVCKQAVEEGVHNPNSRPRAEDLAATCCTLATAGIVPDAELLARLHAIADALGPPW
jgi:tetratricopeptide (TPR) repeat protein